MRTGRRRTWARIITTALTLGMMGLIFAFSSQDAYRSNETSARVSEWVAERVMPEYRRMPPPRRRGVIENMQHIIRKSAHFLEYTILGFLMRCCLEAWYPGRRRLPVLSWAAGTLYAATDEAHQLLVDGRGAQLADVALDSCGVLAGVGLAMLLIRYIRKQEEAQEGCP